MQSDPTVLTGGDRYIVANGVPRSGAMPNTIIHDTRLSPAALGVLMVIRGSAFRAGGTLDDLTQTLATGRPDVEPAEIRAGLETLCQTGYLHRAGDAA